MNDIVPEKQTASKLSKELEDVKSIDPGLGAYGFANLGHSIRFAELMAKSGDMIPKVFQGNIPTCLAIIQRASHWGFDPYGLAAEAFQAKAGQPLAFQAKVFVAVLVKNGIRLRYDFDGEYEVNNKAGQSTKGNQTSNRSADGTRRCIATWVDPDGYELTYESPMLKDITIKNSPLWHNDPDQQLAYYAGRAWARRHRPDLFLGAITPDEIEWRRQPMRDITPAGGSGFAAMARARITQQPETDDEQNTTADPSHPEPDEPAPESGAAVEAGHDSSEVEIDPACPAYQMGYDAAEEGFLTLADAPNKDDPEFYENWCAGFRAATGGEPEDEG